MSVWPRLGKRQQSVKKSSKPNPYAGRGLEKFASVRAELATRRELLAAQTGTPISVLRFTAASETKWIPVFVSPHHHKKKFLSHSISEITNSEVIPPCSILVEGSIASSGDAVSSLSTSYPSLTFKFPASKLDGLEGIGGERAAIGTFPRKKAENLSKIAMGATCIGVIMGALSIGKVVAVGTTITMMIVYLLSKQQAWKILLTGSDNQQCKSEPLKMLDNSSLPEIRSRASHLTSGIEAASAITMASEKPREKALSQPCKLFSRHVHSKKFNTAPSTPVAKAASNIFSSSTPPSPFTASSTSLAIAAIREKNLKRLDSSLRWRTSRPAGAGTMLMVAGICIAMLGLLSGQCLAVFLLACWWYVVPMIRRRSGEERPLLRKRLEATRQARKRRSNLTPLAIGRKTEIHFVEQKNGVSIDPAVWRRFGSYKASSEEKQSCTFGHRLEAGHPSSGAQKWSRH